MKRLLPIFIFSALFAYDVTVVLHGGSGVLMYVNGNQFSSLIEGENVFEGFTGKVTIGFRAPGGIGWVAPEKVLVDSTTTIHVTYSVLGADVKLESEPEGADVYLSYRGSPFVWIGKTPLSKKFPVGYVELKLSKLGYDDMRTGVFVTIDGTSLRLSLSSRNVYRLETNPRSLVILDGVEIGETPLSTLVLPGTHTLDFVIEGLIVESTILRASEYADKEIHIDLPDVHDLFIDTVPSPAFVSIDGKVFRSPVRLKVIEGIHSVECWTEGGSSGEFEYELRADSVEMCRVIEKRHRVKVPRGFEVEIDGKDVKGTEFSVREGVHAFRFMREGKEWLIYRYIDEDVGLDVGEGEGSLVILAREFSLDGRKFFGPAVLNVPSGNHVVIFGSRLYRVSVESGKVTVVPRDSGALILISDPSPLRVSVNGKVVMTPAIVGAVGEVRVKALEGCRIEERFLNLKAGEYRILELESGCGGAGG